MEQTMRKTTPEATFKRDYSNIRLHRMLHCEGQQRLVKFDLFWLVMCCAYVEYPRAHDAALANGVVTNNNNNYNW